MTSLPSFCVVLPMYNERPNAERSIRRINDVLSRLDARTAIIAVDDGSPDGTLEVLQGLQDVIPGLIVEVRSQNGGYGAANRTGFAAAMREGFEYVLVMDADGTQDPSYIKGFIEPMRAAVDFIKATRYAAGGRVEGVPWVRYVVSYVGNKLARTVLRCALTDFTNGFRAIRVAILPRLQTRETGFAVLIEEVCLALRIGVTFAEVPYTLTVRMSNASQSKFAYSWRVYLTYLKHLFRR